MATDILIVEDEPAILASLEFILNHAGWATRSVTDGDAALKALKLFMPKLVILDLMLPKKNGFEVLKIVKTDGMTAHLPVMILTAKGQQQDKRTAMELGASSFVTKPYANSEVVEAVRKLIGNASTGDHGA